MEIMTLLKYAIRNLILQWKYHPIRSMVAELFLLICFATILFSCGIYDNYLNTEKELEASREEKTLLIKLENSQATVEDVKEFLGMLPEEVVNGAEGMASLIWINGDWQNIQYKYNNQQFAYPDIALQNVLVNNWLLSGRLFTIEEFQNGEKVALVPQLNEDGQSNVLGDELLIDGNAYEIIGILEAGTGMKIPITALPENCVVDDIIIGYPYRITKSMYETVVSAVKQSFVSASINEITFDISEEQRQYRRIMTLQLLLIVFSGIGIWILFAVHMWENEQQYISFGFCGVSRKDAIRIHVIHWWGKLIPAIIIAILVFHYSASRWLFSFYPYIKDYACITMYKDYVMLIACVMLFSLSLLEAYYIRKKKV